MKKKVIFLILLLAALVTAGFFCFEYQVKYGKSRNVSTVIFKIDEGEGVRDIARRLSEENIIPAPFHLYYYLKKEELYGKILPGEYRISPGMSLAEVSRLITNDEAPIRITFPEGWDSKKMALRLNENGLEGEGFLRLVRNSGSVRSGYPFLLENDIEDLEGYLFPDTYFFEKDSSSEDIVVKMLDNFEKKIYMEYGQAIKDSGRNLPDIITMASIVEKEVNTDEDRKLVSGLFWNRIGIGQPLQSCATVAFALSKNKEQFTFEDTRVDSPYNTYINRGLPIGPISNPGLSAIEAAIFPEDSSYNYFLSDPETGKTVFSRTLEEHNANKLKYGL